MSIIIRRHSAILALDLVSKDDSSSIAFSLELGDQRTRACVIVRGERDSVKNLYKKGLGD